MSTPQSLKTSRGEVSVYTLASFIIFLFFGLAFLLTGLGFKAQSVGMSQEFLGYMTASRVANAVHRLNNNCDYHCSLTINLPGTLRTALFLAEPYEVSLGPDHVRITTLSGQISRYPVTHSQVKLEARDIGRVKQVVVSK